MIRLVLDSNIYVSAFLSPDGHCGCLVRRLLADGRCLVLISGAIASEVAEVLERPRLVQKYRLTGSEVREFLAWLWVLAEWVEPTHEAYGCRDPDDDAVCATAVGGEAGYLVTRDDDLKRDPDLAGRLARSGVRIVSVSEVNAILDDPV